MKLYFEDVNETSRLIAECHTEEEIMQEITNFIENCNKHKPKNKQFKSRYIRTWEDNGKKWYDVGSHSEFFWRKI